MRWLCFCLLLSLTSCVFYSGCGHTPIKIEHGSSAQDKTLTEEMLAQELGLSLEELKTQAVKLAYYLDNRKRHDISCPEEKKEAPLCKLVLRIEERGIAVESSRRIRVPRASQRNLDQLQSRPFQHAMMALGRVRSEHVMKWSKKILAYDGCPRNITAAAIRKLEDQLPDKEAFQMMEAFYQKASECLKPTENGYEVTHLRQGLLRLLFSDKKSAHDSFKLASETQNPEERGRTLYWLGRLSDSSSEKSKYWNELLEKAPLTYHALLIWDEQKKDPLNILNSRPKVEIERDLKSIHPSQANAIRWLEALYFEKRPGPADKLASWISSDPDYELPMELVLYIGTIKSNQINQHNVIKFLTESIVQNPQFLNTQVLKLLFPTPYLEVYSKYTQNVDMNILLGLSRQESAFNPKARSRARAEGIMQVLPIVAKRKLGMKRKPNLYDVDTNVMVGSRLLRDWMKQFGTIELALMAYNAGPNRVPEWRRRYPTDDMALLADIVPFKETRNYVASVMRNAFWYKRLYKDEEMIVGQKSLDPISE